MATTPGNTHTEVRRGVQGHPIARFVGRRGDLTKGTSAEAIADDYAEFIRREMAEPVREMAEPVREMGISTGGVYAMQLAIRHPDLVDRLVLGFTAHLLPPESRLLQRRFSQLVMAGRWRAAYAMLGRFIYPRLGPFAAAAFWLLGPSLGGTPRDRQLDRLEQGIGR